MLPIPKTDPGLKASDSCTGGYSVYLSARQRREHKRIISVKITI